ncbi:DUF4097 family beta strand repeat-containing protein [Shimazuella kribbensis]|uniref:DUF4097 family beta strand repeat-containing protein n=1 Tax=Shimazuella kribbensis TaxID=139808 RepID=UPI00048BD96B|nr:DUF4097 family beta strand repeat-containing protein [Shimazuella kribbensis]
MNKNLKVVLLLFFIIVIGIIAIVYYRINASVPQPKDDRKTVNQLKDMDSTSANVIEINSLDADLYLHKSKNDQMQAKLSGKIPKQDNVELRWTKQGKELYLDVVYKVNDALETGKNEEEEDDQKGLPAKISLDVSIPSKVYDSIKISTSGGDLTADMPLQGNEIKITTWAGSSKLANLSADQIHVDSREGNIQLKNVKAGFMTLTSFSGNVSLQDYQGGNLKGETQDGDMSLSGIHGGMINLNTKSGDIHVDQTSPLPASNEITTKGGNVTFQFGMVPTDLYLALTSESGNMKNNLPIKKITDKDDDYFGKRYIKGTIGRGLGANLLIGTQKGNINVILKK